MIIIALAAGWIVGLLFGAAGATPLWLAAPVILVLPLLIRFHRVATLRWLLLALIAIPLAALRFGSYREQTRAVDVTTFTLRSVVTLRGVVAGDPLPYAGGGEFPFAVQERQRGGQWLSSAGTIMVRGEDIAPYRPGDRLELAGVLLPPDPLLPPERSLLRQEGIVAVANRPTITPLGSTAASLPLRIARFREAAALALSRAVPEPESGLARGITLGQRRTLSPELAEDFNRTNTSHILAVDGYKVGLVTTVLERTLRLILPPLFTALGTIGGIGAYLLFVGLSPSAQRAAIMGGIYALGRYLGRPRDTLNALAAAALIITALNPYLLWSLAFQLSFVTTLGMTALTPITENWIPHRFGVLREAVGSTIAAEIASAPLVIVAFDHLSLASLPVHAVVMPLLPLAIGLSALTTLVGLIAPMLGPLIGRIAWLPLAAIATVVESAGESSIAALPVPSLGLGAVLLAYLALGLVLLARPNPWFGPALPLGAAWRRLTARVPPGVLVPSLGLPAIALVIALLPPAAPVDRMRFFDLNGDAALIETALGHHVYLQAAAPTQAAARAIEPALPFSSRALDLAVLSVADETALSDLGQLADRLTIRRAIRPADGFSGEAEARWNEITGQRATTVTRIDLAAPGPRVELGSEGALEIYPLDPRPRQGRRGAVEGGLTVRVVLGQASILWASARPEDQAALAERSDLLSAQVLKLVGEATRWGLDPAFFARVNPSVVILPSGAASRYARPTAGTLELLNGRSVYRTDRDGTVTLTAGNDGLTVRTAR